MAKALSSSSIVPEAYRGDQNLGSCIIALEMANRIGANVLSVMQNLYVVHGRPAWSSQFLISCVNASGRFSPLRYTVTEAGKPVEVSYSYTTYVNGQKTKQQGKEMVIPQGCIAWAVDKSGERLESPMVTIDMAVKEGWYTKEGSKWRTMPELMLRYRAATLFARLYAPELTMGIHTDDEVSDVIDVSPVVTEARIKSPDFGNAPQLPAPVGSRKRAKEALVVSVAVPDPNKPEPSGESVANLTMTDIEKVRNGLLKHDIMEAQVVLYMNTDGKRSSTPDYTHIAEVPNDRLKALATLLNLNSHSTIDAIKAMKVDVAT